MRVLIVVGATLAVVAFLGVAVLAVWPAVADAPWEYDPVPAVSPAAAATPPALTHCERLSEQLAAAKTDIAARALLTIYVEDNC